MPIAVHTKPLDLSREMRGFIGRHTDKSFDWDAFPGSHGFPELERAQMRYIGAGGSPKADDPSTLRPGQFTLSLVHQPVGKYAACHSHEVVEHFLVLQGVLTVGWAWGDRVIEARLGPKDMVLNKAGRPHGFRNDGVEPVLMSISVGTGMPSRRSMSVTRATTTPRSPAALVRLWGKRTPLIPTATIHASASSLGISCAVQIDGRCGMPGSPGWSM